MAARWGIGIKAFWNVGWCIYVCRWASDGLTWLPPIGGGWSRSPERWAHGLQGHLGSCPRCHYEESHKVIISHLHVLCVTMELHSHFKGGESFLFFRSQVRQTNVEEQITEGPSAKKSVALRSLEQSSKRTRIEAELWLFSFLNKLSSFDCLNHVAECWTFGHLHLMVCCVIVQGIAKCASGF